jgi:hypothetical protein
MWRSFGRTSLQILVFLKILSGLLGGSMDFFSSDVAVAIAWICGVAGFAYGLRQKLANMSLKVELTSLQNSMNSVETDASRNDVHQTGEKNVYTKQNSGGMNIKM